MKNREEILLRIIHLFAEHFKTDFVLKGGMLLRLLNCPRLTQDVDYVVITKESRKKWAKQIEEILGKIEDIKVDKVHLNSRGIWIDVSSIEKPELQVQIEINIQLSLNLPSEGVSTAALANQYSLMAHIVNAMAPAEAFANKIAAALERDALRDIYDIAQLEPLTPFDITTLQRRFAGLSINRKKANSISFKEAAEMLRGKMERLTEEKLEAELYPLLPQDQRFALLPILKAAISRLIAKLEIQS